MAKGQVALYVLLGVVLLIGVVIAIHVVTVKSSTTTTENPVDKGLSPQCQAEKARMEERANKCLAKKLEEAVADYQEEGDLLPDLASVQAYLQEDVELGFPDCFHEWPILDRLSVDWDVDTKADLVLTDTGVAATVTQPVSGECDGQAYHLRTYTARITSDVKPEFEKFDAVRNELLSNATKLFGKDCGVDPYGLADEGIYTDVLLLDDGSSVVWLYDYNDYLNGGEEKPKPLAIRLPPCHPGENGPTFG